MKIICFAMKQCAPLVVLLAASFGLPASQKHSCPDGPHTLYSKRAALFENCLKGLKSPDGTKLLTVRPSEDEKDPDGSYLSFTVGAAGKEFVTRLPGFDAEVLWAQDSSAFAVTQTEGGGGIGYRVYVFYVGENGLKRVDVSQTIEKAFGTPVKCEVSVPPNTGFIDWVDGSDRILVAAEVVPVSICQCNGTFKVYEVGLPDTRILRSYSQIEAKQKFSNLLGCELTDADDNCAKEITK
jgi:hypothetical protein